MRRLPGAPADFDRVTAGELLGEAFDIGQRLAAEHGELRGAESLAACIAVGAKFYVSQERMRQGDDPHLAVVVEGLARELAHYVLTGEMRPEQVEAACAPIHEGAGHA